MIQINDLSKVYYPKGEKVIALQNINLTFDNTGFVIITGKSGSGKSTLLNIIGGLDSFNNGEIIINNRSTNEFKNRDWDHYRNTLVGFVFQEFYLIDKYPIRENIALALELQGYTKEKINEKVIEVLRLVELEDVMNRLPGEISGGQKQRIAIARSLIKNPDIILCDEPTGNLDSSTGRQILDTLKKLAETKLVIMVTHDTNYAREYGTRIIELKDGTIISDYKNDNRINRIEVGSNQIYNHIIEVPNKLTNEVINYLNERLINENKDYYLVIGEELLKGDNTKIEEIIIKDDYNKIEPIFIEDQKLNLKKSLFPFYRAFTMALNNLFIKKWRLINMIILFILSLVFLGVALTFSFYNPVKLSINQFNKEKITKIPFTKLIEYCDEHCDLIDTPVTDAEFKHFISEYPSINFYEIVVTPITTEDIFKEKEIDEYSSFYHSNISHFVFIDNYEFPLLIGDYPKNNQEVMISDYVAEAFIYYGFYQVDDISDIVDKTFSYNSTVFTISGIVKTDYKKYEELKDNPQIHHDSFRYDSIVFYNVMYMEKSTYNEYFDSKYIETDFDVSNYFSGLSKITSEYIDSNEYLIGRLPSSDDEIVVTASYLKDRMGEDIDLDNLNVDDLIGNTYKVSFSIRHVDNFGSGSGYGSSKTYHLVGVVDDRNISDINYEVILNEAEFKFLKEHTISTLTHTAIALLGNNKNQNTEFLKTLNWKEYRHKTEISEKLSNIHYFMSRVKFPLYIIGIVFTIFTIIIIGIFISTTIKYKQKDIGTLRAIGARGVYVGKIFITEGLIIIVFTAIIANILVGITTILLNKKLVERFNYDIDILYINVNVILMVIVISIIVVFIASFIPISKIVRMKPINAIKKLN